MARVRTAFGHDRFISNIEGVPEILSTDVEVDDDKIEALAKAAEDADVMLVLNAPEAVPYSPAIGTPSTVFNPIPTDQPVLPSSTPGLVDASTPDDTAASTPPVVPASTGPSSTPPASPTTTPPTSLTTEV